MVIRERDQTSGDEAVTDLNISIAIIALAAFIGFCLGWLLRDVETRQQDQNESGVNPL